MSQQHPSLLMIALLIVLLSIGLGALIVLGVRGTQPSDPPPTAAPVVTVLPTSTRPTSTPLPAATAQPIEAILATPSRTPVPPLVLVDTPEPTSTSEPTK